MSNVPTRDDSPSVGRPPLFDETTHSVQFYEHDTFLLDEVARFVGAGLAIGDAVVVIATTAHRRGIEERVASHGVDIAIASAQGRYIPLDAAETMASFVNDERVDKDRFAKVVGDVIAKAAKDSARVRAFGEMVALLAMEGKQEAAWRLEELWNELARAMPFSLLCAYPFSAFGDERHTAPLLRICGEHAHVFPAESYAGLSSSEERLRAIALFQQRSFALDREIAKRAEQQRRAEESLARLAAIVDSSDDAIVGKTLDGIVTSWNEAATRIFGYTANEMIGTPIARLVPADRKDDVPTILSVVRRGERLDHFETERVRKDGRRIYVSVTVSPIRDASGRIIGASKIARDITERKRLEQAKEEFLAMLGHELRNPLAAVQSAIVTARRDASRRERALDIAERQAVQLQKLVGDLLDVARVARGRIVLTKERLSLATVVEHAVEAMRARIDQSGHTVAVALLSEVQVDADEGRLEQVVVNLLVNAVKYTPAGGWIEIGAEPIGEEVVLRVRDNGIGIGPEMLPHVFDLFAQADKGLDRTQGGLGIGLALVRRLVELHGGRVDAKSSGCGQGAEFLVYLPLAHGPAPHRAIGGADETRSDTSSRARVLLVEDSADVADALAMFLEFAGHRVDVVHDGFAALDAADRARPNVMLVDIGLPGIDGFEVARRIGVAPFRNTMLLVALTGYGQEEDKERTRAAGFDCHLTKPVDTELLRRLIARAATLVT